MDLRQYKMATMDLEVTKKKNKKKLEELAL